MGEYFDGDPVQVRTKKDRERLVGKVVRYVRSIDIDRSGRGFFFPRWGIVTGAHGRELILENGYLNASDVVEIVVVRDATPEEMGS